VPLLDEPELPVELDPELDELDEPDELEPLEVDEPEVVFELELLDEDAAPVEALVPPVLLEPEVLPAAAPVETPAAESVVGTALGETAVSLSAAAPLLAFGSVVSVATNEFWLAAWARPN
jgi:hypothetical protein